MKHLRQWICAAAVLAGHVVQARELVFLPGDSLGTASLLASPAGPGSALLMQELSVMRQVQADRTQAQVDGALSDDADESMLIFAAAIGPAFKPAVSPLTTALTAKVKADAGVYGAAAKLAFQRPHPYHVDSSLKPVCPTKVKKDSYPSGHSLAGYLQALVLIDLIPERRDAILQRAAAYAQNRVICGVNYPSDLEASRLLAHTAFGVLSQQPAYRQEATAARAELRLALGLPSVAN